MSLLKNFSRSRQLQSANRLIKHLYLMFFLVFFGNSATSENLTRVGVIGSITWKHPSTIEYSRQNFTQGLTNRYLLKYERGKGWLCDVCIDLPSTNELHKLYKAKRKKNQYWFVVPLKIRKDLKWSDGKPFTIDDLIFSWKVYKRYRLSVSNSDSSFLIEDITKSPDTDIVYLKLKDFRIDIHSYMQVPIVRQSLESSVWFQTIGDGIDKYLEKSKYSKRPLMDGLYLGEVNLSYTPDKKLLVKRGSERYSISPCLHLSSCVRGLTKNEFDIISSTDPLATKSASKKLKETFNQIRSHPKIDMEIRNIPRVEFIHFNSKNPKFLDKTLRHDLFSGIFNFDFYNSFLSIKKDKPPGFYFFGKHLDFSKSKNSGSKRRNLESLNLVFQGGTKYRKALLQDLESRLKQKKIKINPVEMDSKTFRKKIIQQNNYKDLLLISWEVPLHTVPFSMLHSSEIPYGNRFTTGQNLSNYANVELDKMLNRLLRLDQSEKKIDLMIEIEKHIIGAKSIIPIFYHREVTVFRKDFAKFIGLEDGFLPLSLNNYFRKIVSEKSKRTN